MTGVDMVIPIYAIHRNFETSARALAELKAADIEADYRLHPGVP